MKAWLVSYGGSGTNLLADYAGLRCPLWEQLLCHCGYPEDLGLPTLVIVAHPCDAFESQRRRGLLAINKNKMQCTMLEFLQRWAAAEFAAIVKYESLWNHLDEVGAHLGIDMSRFPAHRPRETQRLDLPPLRDAVRLFDSLPSWRPASQ